MPFDGILAAYFPRGARVLETGETGYNNMTRFVEAADGRYVLRIYGTHRDPGKIRFEHEVLESLGANLLLPFRVPQPVRNPLSGETFMQLEDGSARYACLFRYIEGIRPDAGSPAFPEAAGDASGCLSDALGRLRPRQAPAYPPYYRMDAAHPSCSPSYVADFCAHPPEPFASSAAELRLIGRELADISSRAKEWESLPHQLVHGDLNASNMLGTADGSGEIAAILDFEFCTWDLRVMEPAVVLSEMIQGEDGIGKASRYLQAFENRRPLSAREKDAIPGLIRLRLLDVFVHFLGRYRDGVDPGNVLLGQIRYVCDGIAELAKSDRELAALCRNIS